MAEPWNRSALNVRTVRALPMPKERSFSSDLPDDQSDISLGLGRSKYASPYSPISYGDNGSSYSGYAPDTRYSVGDASSVGSVTSYSPNTQYLDVKNLPLANGEHVRHSTDSGVFSSQRTRSIASSESSYRETDLDSVMTSGSSVAPRTRYGAYRAPSDDRYNEELYRPRAAPRKTIEAKKMFGEIHPRLLAPTDIPVTDSDNDLDDQSSLASLSERPVAAPRASMRMKKSQSNPAFIEDELDNSGKNIPRGILRSATDSNVALSAKKARLVVRFQQVEKENTNIRDLIDYNAIDSDTGSTKSKKKNADIWGHVKPVSKKPARNDPIKKPSSNGRQSRSNSSSGRQSRSSSHDRSRSGQRSSSMDRSSQRSNSKDRGSSQRSNSKDRGSAQRSSSLSRSDSTQRSREQTRSHSNDSKSLADKDVKIEITPEAKKHESMVGEIIRTTDRQKLCKWILIVGIPLALLIAVGVIVGLTIGK